MPMYPSNSLISSSLGLITAGTPYLALYTSNPTAADSGTEVSGGSYARKAITFGSVSGGQIKNTAAISFPGMPTANVTHFGIRSAASGGTLRLFGPLSSIAATISGDEVVIPVNGITVGNAGS